MLNNDACVGRSLLTSEVPKDRVMVISLMVGCWRTRAETGIVQTEKGSIRLVMLMINYASVERLGRRQRQSWICDMERNNIAGLHIQLGHGGASCISPKQGPLAFTVVDVSGIHLITIDFCNC